MCDKSNPSTTDTESTEVYSFVPDEIIDQLEPVDLDDDDSEDDDSTPVFNITPDEARARLRDFDFSK